MTFPPPPKPFGSDPPLSRALVIPNVDFLNYTVRKFFAQSSFTGTCAFAFLAPIILMCDELSMPDGCTWNLKNNWPNALAFLTAKRSYEQFETLKADLNNCDCALAGDPEAKSRHETARSKYNDWINLHDFAYAHSEAMTPFHCLFSHLFYGLYACLKSKSAARIASRQARRWPQSPSDLLPHGADATIQSLEQWLEHIRFPDAGPALLLVEIVRASRSLIVPTMLRSSKLPSLITAIMGEICQDARSSLAAPWFKTMPGATRAVALDFDRRISHIVPFMQLFSTTRKNQLSTTEFSRFWKEEDKQMFFHATDIIRIYTETCLFTQPFEGDSDPRAGASRKQTIATFREVTAGTIHDLVAKYGMSRDALEAGARLLSDSWGESENNLRAMLYNALFKLKIDRRCGYLGCTETLQTTKLKKCTGCKVMFWCSQAHQKLGWTHDELPHREVCSSMARLVDKVNGDFRVNTQRALELAKGQTVADIMEIAKVLKWIQRFNTARSAGPIIVGAELLFQVLRAHKKDGCCSSIACRRALPKPNWCSKCKIFKYCNRDCIAAGWTDPLAPHKDVCKRIKNVVECAGGDLELVDVQSARFAERMISLEEDLITIRNWFGRFNSEYKK